MSCQNYVAVEEVHTEYGGDTAYTYVTTYWQCRQTGDGGIPEYCSSTGCVYCPRLGGDDRYRRADALTEYMSAEIAGQVHEIIDSASLALRTLLCQVRDHIAATGYELLRACYDEAGNRGLCTPSVFGGYASVVFSPMEKHQAAVLELQIQDELNSFRTEDLLPRIYMDPGSLTVSSRDFDRLYDTLGDDGGVMTALRTRICPGGFLSLGAPAMNVLLELADQVDSYLRQFQQSILEAQRQFEDGVLRSTDGAAFFGGSYNGPIPDWHREI